MIEQWKCLSTTTKFTDGIAVLCWCIESQGRSSVIEECSCMQSTRNKVTGDKVCLILSNARQSEKRLLPKEIMGVLAETSSQSNYRPRLHNAKYACSLNASTDVFFYMEETKTGLCTYYRDAKDAQKTAFSRQSTKGVGKYAFD